MGDSVLLAAAAELDMVLVHPPTVFDKMMAVESRGWRYEVWSERRRWG